MNTGIYSMIMFKCYSLICFINVFFDNLHNTVSIINVNRVYSFHSYCKVTALLKLVNMK